MTEEFIKRILNSSFYKKHIENIYYIKGSEEEGLLFTAKGSYSSKEYRDFIEEVEKEGDPYFFTISHINTACREDKNGNEYLPELTLLIERKD